MAKQVDNKRESKKLPPISVAVYEDTTEGEDETESDLEELPRNRPSIEALRYIPSPPGPRRFYHPPKYTKIPVLKKRRVTTLLSTAEQTPAKRDPETSLPTDRSLTEVSMAQPSSIRISRNIHDWGSRKDSLKLNPKILTPESPTVWVNSNANVSGLPPLMVLRRARSYGKHQTRTLDCSYEREFAALNNFERAKRKQLMLEDYIMEKTGKSLGNLLLRRKQLLPKLDIGGRETTQLKIERTVTPENFTGPDLFIEDLRLSKERNGICYTKSRQERGFDVIDEWIGCPEITDYIRMLRFPTFDVCDDMFRDNIPEGSFTPPIFPGLGVVGLKYETVQNCLKGGQYGKHKSSRQSCKDMDSLFASRSNTKDVQYIKSWASSARFTMIESPLTPVVSLVLGNAHLSWSLDPASSHKKWVIELGCTADVGRNAVSSVNMKNTGTTVIHFNWVKIPPGDAFQLNKYNLRRFVFDCWGGTILPGETFRVPFLYKCTECGFYSEDWKLLTQPVLENGAEIIVRLWGITRQYDPYFRERNRIDEALNARITQSIVKQRVDKIIDYLPLKEIPLNDTRFPLVHLGPDLFQFHNPWLHYHCAEVYKLGELAKIVEERRERHKPSAVQWCGSEFSVDSAQEDSTITAESETEGNLSDHLFLIHDGGEEDDSDQGDVTLLVDDHTNVSLSLMTVPGSSWDNTRFMKRTLGKLINPDLLSLKNMASAGKTAAGSTKGTGSDVPPGPPTPAPLYPLAPINITNVEFSVDEMRSSILKHCNIRLELQEALFMIMAEQVTRLSFRPFTPLPNWKLTVVRGLLCEAMDAFSSFAHRLRLACCESQIRKDHQRMSIAASKNVSYLSVLSSEEVDATLNAKTKKETSSSGKGPYNTPLSTTSGETGSQRLEHGGEMLTMEVCPFTNPRTALDYVRFQNQYYARLHTRMYEILVDFIETMDALLYKEEADKKLDWKQIGFTKVKKIPMKVSIVEILDAPLPPRWVHIAQRIDNTYKMIRARKLALEYLELNDSTEKDLVKESKKGQKQDLESDTKQISSQDDDEPFTKGE